MNNTLVGHDYKNLPSKSKIINDYQPYHSLRRNICTLVHNMYMSRVLSLYVIRLADATKNRRQCVERSRL